MTDTFVTPRVWVAGERVSAAKMLEISSALNALYPYAAGGDIAYRDPAGNYLSRLAKPSVDSVFTMGNSGVAAWLAQAAIPGRLHTMGYVSSSTGANRNSTSFGDVTGMSFNLSLTATCTILAFAFGVAYTNTGVYEPTFAINIDGTIDTNPHSMQRNAEFYPGQPFSTLFYKSGITAGTRAIKLQFKVANAAETVYFRSGKMVALAFAE